MSDLYIALIHFPVVNKEGKIVTTSVTNFDLHDLARNAKTFGVKKVFILTPNPLQLNMVKYIKDYWMLGRGGQLNPDRKEAFEVISEVKDLDETYLTIQNLSGKKPLLVATTAKITEKSVSYCKMAEKIKGDLPVLVAFGTGFGLTQEFIDRADFILEPIVGAGSYNHLPVRSAVAIILDRLVNVRV